MLLKYAQTLNNLGSSRMLESPSERKYTMKKILVSLALLLAFAVIPAMAGEKAINNQDPAAFQALSKLSAPGQTVLNKMTDEQLAKIEGQRRIRINVNYSSITQSNECVFCDGGANLQINLATVNQSN
jgi:hypothetical protein